MTTTAPPAHAVRESLGQDRQRFRHGPIDLIVDVEADAPARREAFDTGFGAFESVLPELVQELDVLRSSTSDPRPLAGAVATAMRAAAKRCSGGAFATPMIAVAGAVADHVNQAVATTEGVRRVIVNNGGDISFTLTDGGSAIIGIVESLGTSRLAGRVEVAFESEIRGVATSGAAGRSLSLGLADAVTVFARTAAAADAAATLIANNVDLQNHPGIERGPADSIDESAGLGARPIPVRIPRLPSEEARAALLNGAREAQRLRGIGAIEAAILSFQGNREIVGDPVMRRDAT